MSPSAVLSPPPATLLEAHAELPHHAYLYISAIDKLLPTWNNHAILLQGKLAIASN